MRDRGELTDTMPKVEDVRSVFESFKDKFHTLWQSWPACFDQKRIKIALHWHPRRQRSVHRGRIERFIHPNRINTRVMRVSGQFGACAFWKANNRRIAVRLF